MTKLKAQAGSGDFTKAYNLVRALLERGTPRDMATIVSLAYVMVGSRLEGVIERRRYGLNFGHRNIKGDLTKPELFQLCLFDRTELAERKEEDEFAAEGLHFDPDRLVLRYVKFIVRNVFDAATFNVAMAVSRQLFGLDWISSEFILSSILTSGKGQTQGDRVLRRLVRKLKVRFDHITETGSDGRGHQYFYSQPVTRALGKAVHLSLRLVTPWGSSHVVPRTFRRGDQLDDFLKRSDGAALSRAARIGGEEQAMIDRNRRHSFIDLKCFSRLAKANGIRDLLSRVCVPRFTNASDSDASSGSSHALQPKNEPPTEYWEKLFSEIARRDGMKARFTGGRLVVRIDSHDVGYLEEKSAPNLNFEVTEEENIISFIGFQEKEEIPIVTIFPRSDRFFDLERGQHWSGKTRLGHARLHVRVTQLGKIHDGSRSVSVDVNYKKRLPIPDWPSLFSVSRVRVRALQTVAAATLFAIFYGAYHYLINSAAEHIPPVPVVDSAYVPAIRREENQQVQPSHLERPLDRNPKQSGRSFPKRVSGPGSTASAKRQGVELASNADDTSQGVRSIVSDDFVRNRKAAHATSKAQCDSCFNPYIQHPKVSPGKISALRQRRTYRLASEPVERTPLTINGSVAQLGVTIWKLRPPRADDSAARMLVRENGSLSEWIPTRVEGDSTFREGDHVRLSIESPRNGYLYVVDRDLFADGTTGPAILIYPTTRLQNGDNRVWPGTLVDIPAREDEPSYFIARPTPNQVGEILTIIVTKLPIDLPISNTPLQISSAAMEKWERIWGGESERFEMEGGVGETWTNQEEQASARKGARLTRQDPPPQTIYRISGADNNGLLINVRLRYAKDKAEVRPLK